jgi:hypothetical protein
MGYIRIAEYQGGGMNTLFLLMARYDGLPIIPVEAVCRDYFHLTVDKFLRKVLAGEIPLPIVRVESSSQKTAKGVPIKDLADYLDMRIDAARKECEQLKLSA